MINGLQSKKFDTDSYAEKLINDSELISQYLDGLLSKNETYRYNCFKVLQLVSEKKPELLYPHWNFFVNHLNSGNNYHQMSAVIIIANITAVDKEQRFEDIFDFFYENLKTEKTIVPIYIIKSSGKIINYKPHLEGKITDLFINIEKIHPGKQIELVKSAVIESFSEIFNKSSKKNEIMSFVKNQLKSTSPKTKKAAKKFLSKWGEN